MEIPRPPVSHRRQIENPSTIESYNLSSRVLITPLLQFSRIFHRWSGKKKERNRRRWWNVAIFVSSRSLSSFFVIQIIVWIIALILSSCLTLLIKKMNFALYFYFRIRFRRKSYLFTRFLKLLIFLSSKNICHSLKFSISLLVRFFIFIIAQHLSLILYQYSGINWNEKKLNRIKYIFYN